MTDSSRVSCSEYSFSAVPRLRERVGLVRLLGFELVDIGLFGSSVGAFLSRRQDHAMEIRAALAESVVSCADLFYAAGETFDDIALNSPDSEARRERRDGYAAALSIAVELGITGVTVLPGIVWADDPAGAWECCIEELSWRLDLAESFGVELRIEPHVGSIVSMPEAVLSLVESLPDLRLTFDQAHFDAQSVQAERLDSVTPWIGHVHVRGAKEGAIQVRWRDSESDIARLVARLSVAEYAGAYCIEYVAAEKWRCDEVDVVSETLAAKASLEQLSII
jgi:sugar phosphate isomerase/epimerase